MRIVLALGSSAGGVGRHVQGLVTGLLEQGHQVVVACPCAVEGHFGFGELGAVVHPVEISDRPRPRDALAMSALRRLAAGADVVHAHGLRAGALASIGLARSGVPLVVTLHNAAPEGRVSGPIYAALERVVVSGADLILGVSPDLVDRARALGASRVSRAVVAAPPAPANPPDATTLRNGLGLPPHSQLVVTAARLAPQKDLGTLLDAVGALDIPEVVLAIAGDGPQRAELAARIRREELPVRLLGHRSDVPDLLAAADVVVSSARWEGQPVWLQEALYSAAAIVATDAGGTADVLGDAAVLVPVGDATSLAAALRDVLRHSSVREDLRRRAAVRAGELPTAADALGAVLTAYGSVLR